ncbi:hypothetical protein [Oceaniglobus indicus]|uniref:hypothetical protein n=1 Tax=Oceaniglobus indicus TaxID=2047749 RepID=UPI000C19D474|nr:hypothetical protein [Oceaniglobus indicus]
MIRRLARALCLVPCLAPGVSVAADPVDPVAASRLSDELFMLATDTQDALLMIAAAKLRKQARVPRIERRPERDGDLPSGDLPGPREWQDMLAAALALDPDDAVMVGLARDVRAASVRGVASGRVESRAQIRAGGRDTYQPLVFSGGAWADVYVEGAGRADLDLFVRDGAGRMVCSDTDASAIAYCGWRVDTSDSFAVEVLNAGRVATTYRLMTN